ncbi:MAG: VIT1/CCC1 transporter family protein [bacterium]|nr:VIT1/CCC1 transporter family protein [bacterium]
MRIRRANLVSYFRNFIFGVEDSLVSTVGLLSGIAMAGVPRETILLTGAVLIFVEAFSMAAGSFLSEYSADEYANGDGAPAGGSAVAGTIMFFSYFLSGFVPLFPYLLWPTAEALRLSVFFSVAALFALGAVSAVVTRVSVVRNGIRMAFVGGVAIAVGSLAGIFLSGL